MALESRTFHRGAPPVPHGGLLLDELTRAGIAPESVLDFSVSVHPLGPSPAVLAAARSAALGRYPDPEARPLRQAIAGFFGLDERNVWVGNGASEIIWLVCQALLEPGDGIFIVGPTYGEYCRAARLAGAAVGEYWSPEQHEFRPDMDEIELAADLQRPRVVFVCNPNNPTGVYLDRETVERLAALPGRPTLILDEAFVSFTPNKWDSLGLLRHANVVLVRSMTKDHGIPGLRLGYAIASDETIDALRQTAPPWSVNAAAIAAGLAALDDRDHLVRGRRLVAEIAEYLQRSLARLGLQLRPSAANFWLVQVGDATRLRQALLPKGILVRDCASFGLPAYVRLGSRPLEDCARLIGALANVLAEDPSLLPPSLPPIPSPCGAGRGSG